MNFNLLIRHYWSYAKNNNILQLEDNGNLIENATYTENKDSDFSTWNFDLSYNWWFAPGSQMSVLYRNNALIDTNAISSSFSRNLNNLANNNQLDHIFSISFRYFIDYNSLKH
jgi:hypothetical protein